MSTERERLSLLHSNSLYDGIQLDDVTDSRLLGDWLRIHLDKLIFKRAAYLRRRLAAQSDHSVEKLIEEYSPTLITLNEVMPYLGKSYEILKSAGYTFFSAGGVHVEPPLTNDTVVASRSEMEFRALYMPGRAGSGAVGAFLPEHNLLLFSAHPSAFNPSVRSHQLKSIAEQITWHREAQPDASVIFTGDLNTDSQKMIEIFTQLGLRHHTDPEGTFPSPSLYRALQRKRYALFRRLLGIHKGRRSLDHVFSDIEVTDQRTIETSSDHLALLFRFALPRGQAQST